MPTPHQHRRKTKIRIKQTMDIQKKKNREKNFSFRRFLLFLSFRAGALRVLQCHSERRSGGPESRNLPLSSDLSTAARGDIMAVGTAERADPSAPLGVTTMTKEKRNGKGSECVFVSMSVFPFLFFERRRAKAAGPSTDAQDDSIGNASDPSTRYARSG